MVDVLAGVAEVVFAWGMFWNLGGRWLAAVSLEGTFFGIIVIIVVLVMTV